jgi:uncharacterized protein YxjI
LDFKAVFELKTDNPRKGKYNLEKQNFLKTTSSILDSTFWEILRGNKIKHYVLRKLLLGNEFYLVDFMDSDVGLDFCLAL